jgi:VCBS repeat-containing protein
VLSDFDGTAASVVAQSGVAGRYGSFSIDATGQWSYATNGRQDQLNAGQVVSDLFAVATSDGGSATVAITITGSNDGPSFGGGLLQATVTELKQDDPLANTFAHGRTGSVAFNDADLGDLHSVEIGPAAGNYRGNFSASIPVEAKGKDGSVAWSYSVADADLGSLDAGQVIRQTYQLTLRDQAGAVAETRLVTIALIGSTDVPVAARLEGRQGDSFNVPLPANLFSANGGNGTLAYSLEPFTLAGVSYPVPSWLSINSSTGRLTGVPGAGAIGDNTLAVVASDRAGGRTLAYLTIGIANINDAPGVTLLAKASLNAIQDSPTNLDVSGWFADADRPFLDATGGPLDSLTYAVKEANPASEATPTWFSIDASTGLLRLAPTNAEVGQRSLQIQATDGSGASAVVTTTVTVSNINDRPALNPTVAAGFSRRSVPEDSPFRIVIPADLFSDPDQAINPAERLQFSVVQADGQALPSGWQFDPGTRVLTGSTVGLLTSSLMIQAWDMAGTSAASPHLLTLAVDRQATAPQITLLNSTPQALEGGLLRLSDALVVTNTDPDSEQLGFLLEAPGGASLELVTVDGSGQPGTVIPSSAAGQWRLTSLEGVALRLTNPYGSGNASLQLTATSTEPLGVASGPASASASATLQASFIPVANAPQWQLGNPGANDPLARTKLGAALAADLLDPDGSESISYRLTWADQASQVSVTNASGTALGVASSQGVVLSAAEWGEAILVEQGGSGTPLDLTVVAIATEAANGDSRESEAKGIAWAATPQLSPEPFAIQPATTQINRYDGGTATSGQRGALTVDLQIPAGAMTVQLEFSLPAGSFVLDGDQRLPGSQALDGSTKVLLTYDVASLSGQAKPWEQLGVVAPEGFKGLWQGSVRLLSSARASSSDPFGSATFATDQAGRLAVVSDPVTLNLAVLAQARQPSLVASYDPTTQGLQITLQRGHSLSNAFDGEEALALVVRGVPDGLVLVDANNRPVGATDAYGTTVLINRAAVAPSLASQAETLNLALIRRPGSLASGTLSGSLSLALTALLPGEAQGGDSRSTPVERQLDLTGDSPIRELDNIDPLMLDLGGDGLALVDLAASPVRFDTLALGLPFPTAWLQTAAQATPTNDAFVVVDRNGDGQITSISELLSEYFGSSDGRRTATSGLDALAQFDTNRDGQIDAADNAWTSLKLWFDHGNGLVESGELVPLASRLSSINLSLASPLSQLASNQPAWAAGNQILRSTLATAVNSGDRPTLYDVGLGVALAPAVAQAASLTIQPGVSMAEDSYGTSLTIGSTAIEAAINSQSIGSDSVLVRLMGLPEAVVPNLGVKDQRGDWLFTWKDLQQQANRLVLASTNQWSGSSNLQVIASQIRADGSVVGSTLATSLFTVTPVADTPLLRLQSGRVEEDGSILLSQLVRQASLRDQDGSESLSFQLTADDRFSLWNGSSLARAANGYYQIDQLDSWSLRPLSQFSGQVEITLAAVATERGSSDPSVASASVSLSTNLQVLAVADQPSLTLETRPLTLEEGGVLPLASLGNTLKLQISGPDRDGSEQLLLRLGHLNASLILETIDPSDSRRITASRNSDGSRDLVIDAADLPYLQLRDALGTCPDQFSIELSAIARERSNGDEASGQVSTVPVDLLRYARPASVLIQSPAPQLEAAEPRWDLNDLLAVTPASATDRLVFVLSGLSSDLSLRSGDGSLLTPDSLGQVRLSSLEGLQLERPADFSGSLSLALEVLSTASWGGPQSTSGRQSLKLQVLATPTSPIPQEWSLITGSGLSRSLEGLFSPGSLGDPLHYGASVNRLQQQSDGTWQEQGQPLAAPWLTIASDATTGASLTLNPGREEAGRYRLNLQATDGQGATSHQTIDLEVIAANAEPQVTRQLGAIASDDNSLVTLNLAELFGDLDLSQPVASPFAVAASDRLSFSYALIGGDQAWVDTTLAGVERPIAAIQMRESSSSDAWTRDLLTLSLPGVDRTLQTTLRLFATDASGSQASQDVTLTITPRVQVPLLAAPSAPSSVGQGESLRLGQLLSELPQLADPEGDVLSLRIRTLPGVSLHLPEGYLGALEPLPGTTSLELADGRQVQVQGWRLQISSSDPGRDLALLQEVSLLLPGDTGLLQPGTGAGTGQSAVIALPVDLALEATVRGAAEGAGLETLPTAVGSSQLAWVPIQNQAPQFDWGAPARFVNADVGSQPQGVLADLPSLFLDPDLGGAPTGPGDLQWQLDLPSRLEGLIELDPATGTLAWKAGASLDADLAGSYRILVSAFDSHYALGDSSAIARGVVQLFVKAPGAPASAMEDLVTRLQNLPLINGARSWSVFQSTDASLSAKNMVATSELLSGDIGFLAPEQAIAALPSGLTLASNLSQAGLDPMTYTLATDQPGGWYSLVDFAVTEQSADGLVVMKGYDADHSTVTTELAYRQYHSRFVSFDTTAQLQYGGVFARWLGDQQFSISTYLSQADLLQVSEAQLQDSSAAAALVDALPMERGPQGDRIAADGSALLIDSNGDGKVDYIRLLLIDNGLFDLDPAQGQVSDPMALLPVTLKASGSELRDANLFAQVAWTLKQQREATATSVSRWDLTGSGEGLGGLSAGQALPDQGPNEWAGIELGDEDRKGEDPSIKGLDAPKIKVDTVDDLLTVEVQDVLESTKETLQNVTDSIKETVSKLLGNKDVVSSRLLAGLLLPAGGGSIAEQLLGRISPGGNHRLAQRDRNLRGRWRLGQGRRVLTLADGRVRLTRQDDPIATAPLEGFPAGDDPRLVGLESTRLLDLVRRSPRPAQVLALIQGQLRSLLIGTMPVPWSAWLQELPAALAYPSRLQAWRARTSLKHFQNELAHLGSIDPALMDVLMAAELAACLEAFEIDCLPETDIAATPVTVERGASMAST